MKIVNTRRHKKIDGADVLRYIRMEETWYLLGMTAPVLIDLSESA